MRDTISERQKIVLPLSAGSSSIEGLEFFVKILLFTLKSILLSMYQPRAFEYLFEYSNLSQFISNNINTIKIIFLKFIE